MRFYRLHLAKRMASDYGGSLLYEGRWNPAGVAMLYASSTLSLACLEQLVHLSLAQIPLDYAFTAIHLDLKLETADYRGTLTNEGATRRYGHRWAICQTSAAMLVPSVVIPIEYNLLLNPLHPDFSKVTWSAPERFEFDQRLFKSSVLLV